MRRKKQSCKNAIGLAEWSPGAHRSQHDSETLTKEEKQWQHMTKEMKEYKKVQFAGNFFRTGKYQKDLKTDDSKIRQDYRDAGPARGQTVLRKAYATITRMFVHEAFPGGPSRVIVEGEWFRVMGECPVAHTTLVKRDKDFHFNHSMRFVFLEDCYSRPVALWPFDPLHRLEQRDPKRGWFHVIDRNQSELDD